MPSLKVSSKSWQLIEQSAEFANSGVDKSLRMMHRAFKLNARVGGDPLPFAVDVGDRVNNFGLFADLESPHGKLIKLSA